MAESEDTEGWTNLHHAVAGKFTNLVQSLLEAKEEGIVNTQDGQGRTPLHLACFDIVEEEPLFLKCGSEYLTCKTLKETNKIIELLLRHGADTLIVNRKGKSPLHCLVEYWLVKQYPMEKVGEIITRFQHRRFSSINLRDSLGRTLLHYVAGSSEVVVPLVKPKDEKGFFKYRHSLEENDELSPEQGLLEFLVKLLSYGADMNVTDIKGNTPLHLAIITKKFKIVKELLRGESKINTSNWQGQTPFHHAVSDDDKFRNCAILSMHKGALASIEDVKGNTPFDICRGKGYFTYFLKHLIILINAKIHPEMDEPIGVLLTGFYGEFIRDCMRECKDLISYFELQGKSQLTILLQYHSIPNYTENKFFQSKINCANFSKRFQIYSDLLKSKFLQDENRREMIEVCTKVFMCFGTGFYYTPAGRLAYTKKNNWEMMAADLKVKILSYLSDSELDYLKKRL